MTVYPRTAAALTLLLGACTATLELDKPATDAALTADLGRRIDASADGGGQAVDARPPDARPAVDGAADGCQDADGDGFGEGCPAGLDCDDADPARFPGADERCDGVDNDCDGQIDEGWPNLGMPCQAGLGACATAGRFACAPGGAGLFCDAQPGEPTPERCNSVDDDCDGVVDEDVADCCDAGLVRLCGSDLGECSPGEQACGPDRSWGSCSGRGPRPEACDGLDNDCDGRVDEGVLNACGACGPAPSEVCDGRDNDCDGRVDEGVLNACGACGAVPREVCDGVDNDCDGQVDEGVLNACGGCGPVPREVCDGVDNDCDGRVDEGVLNACGGCGPVPREICDGVDNDCDGRVDEGACRAYLLAPGADRWTQPPGLNRGGPLGAGAPVDAAAAFYDGGVRIWAFSGDLVWLYDPLRDQWLGDVPLGAIANQRGGIDAADTVPGWWRRFWGGPGLDPHLRLVRSGESTQLLINPATRVASVEEVTDLAAAWAGLAHAPDPRRLRAVALDLRNARGWWPGRPADLYDAGWCFRFAGTLPAAEWPGFALPGAPDPARITAWTHLEPELEGQGAELVFVAP